MCLNVRMEKRETPGSIARQYGVRPMDIYKVMQEMKLGVGAMGAKLNGPQAQKLHAHYQNMAKVNEDRAKRNARKLEATQHSPLVTRGEGVTMPVVQKPRPEREWPKHCECCDLKWIYLSDEDTYKPHCPQCEGHHPKAGEDLTRRLRRATNHAERYRAMADRAYASAAQAHDEKQQAYRSRTHWNRALAEVVLDHEPDEDGNCWCGIPYPCRTWRKLEEANKGVHRQVEKWSTLSEERLAEVLYGDDYSRMLDEEQRDLERRARALADSRAEVDESLVYPQPKQPLRNPSNRASSG